MNPRDLKQFNAHASHCLACAGAALDEPIGKFCATGQRLLDEAWEQRRTSTYKTSVTLHGTVKVKLTRGTDLPESEDEAIRRSITNRSNAS